MSLPAPARGPESPPDDAAHLLVVDDDMRIRTLLTRFLGSHGFRVTAAASAEEARRHLAAMEFDLLVVDEQLDARARTLRDRLAFRLLTFYTREAHSPRALLPAEAVGITEEQISRFYFCLSFRMPLDAPVSSAH